MPKIKVQIRALTDALPSLTGLEELHDKSWDYLNDYTHGGQIVIKSRFQDGRIECAITDGQPMGIAGLWDRYRDAAGQWQDSYTMLTINADDHPLFKHYHQSGKEKRMVVMLPEGAYGDWLTAPASDARDFLVPYPADRLVATPMRPGNPES
ncbi:hypothetical protein CQ050_13650 [Achromobacter sp. MYb9]|nr:hypothetical protein CQ050_13650 [Achromobacter sp. MYb9]